MKLSFLENEEFKKRFSIISIVIFLFVYPIIHSNVYYKDDYPRSLYSYIGMSVNGRYLSQILIYIMSFSKHVCDTAPLFQILSIFVLAATLSLLSISWNFGRFSSFFVLPLIACSPFFLENLSYRYDSLPMALALSCACLAHCRYSENRKTSFLIKSLFVLASLNFYQPAINAFLSLMSLGGLLCLWDKGVREAIKSSVHDICSAGLAMLFYKMELLAIPHGDYYNKHSSITLNVHGIISNLIHFLNISLGEFGVHGKGFEIFLGLVVLSGLINILWIFYRKNGVFGSSIAVFYIVFSLYSLVGPLAFLKSPTFDLRIFMANGVFLCIYVTFLIGRQHKFAGSYGKSCLAICILFIQIVFSCCWANAVKAQTSLNEYIAREILEDLSRMPSSDKSIYIRFISSFPVSAQAQAIWEERRAIFQDDIGYPVSGWIEMAQGSYENEHMLIGTISEAENIMGPENENFTIENARDMQKSCLFQTKIHHRYYDMYIEKGNVLIDFSRKCSGG